MQKERNRERKVERKKRRRKERKKEGKESFIQKNRKLRKEREK